MPLNEGELLLVSWGLGPPTVGSRGVGRSVPELLIVPPIHRGYSHLAKASSFSADPADASLDQKEQRRKQLYRSNSDVSTRAFLRPCGNRHLGHFEPSK
mmetsp:Transcript_25376/g.76449  ORF Transcript_25376/g.76449 Transcript_25376/m.76449 type:complete len:99 (-) Transcript_25376:594-890(-)